MRLLARPSKIFLFNILESELKKVMSGDGLDAASADFKNRQFFKTDKYYGLDIDLLALERGINRYDDGKTFGILADMTKLDKIPGSTFNVVVSTNTLDHFVDKAPRTVAELCRVVAPNGTIILHMAINSDIRQILATVRQSFATTKVVYLKNPISKLFESIFETGNGFLTGRSKLFQLVAWIISRTEYITYHFHFMNEQVAIVGHDKIKKNNRHETLNLPACLNHKRVYGAL